MPWLWAFMMCWLSVSAQAGAWPREQGSVFIAVSADQARSQIFAEYGLRGDWTLGTEVSMPRGRRLPDVTQFVHHPVWRGHGGAILSAGAAVELRETKAASALSQLKGESEMAIRVGLSWGKGFETPFGSGWATLDAQVEKLVTTDWLNEGLTFKFDVGFGVKPMEKLMIMAQAQFWQRGNAQDLRLETSAAWALGRTHFVVSPSVGVVGPKAPRVKLGVWVTF